MHLQCLVKLQFTMTIIIEKYKSDGKNKQNDVF